MGEDDERKSIAVRYALRVAGSPPHLLEIRNRSQVAGLDPEKETLHGKFSADAMWAMILEAQLVPEFPVPPRRRSLGFVPDFGEIAERNGPLIAAKLEAILNKTFGAEIAPQLAFLCPDEPRAIRLARSLRALAGHDTIYVPRPIIDLFNEYETRGAIQIAIEQLDDEEREKVLPSLRKLEQDLAPVSSLTTKLPIDDRPHIVLLDEFGYSGSTLRGLYNVATSYGLRILCSVSLANLSEKNLKSTPVQALTLYSLEYPTV